MILRNDILALSLMIAQRIDSDNIPGLYKGDVGTMGGKSYAVKAKNATTESYNFYIQTAEKINNKKALFENLDSKTKITRRVARAFLAKVTLTDNQVLQAFSFDKNTMNTEVANEIVRGIL